MNGLVLIGGQSRRMGQPKCLLDYFGQPQYSHAAGLLAPFCEQVFLSCRIEQQSLFEGFPFVFDNPELGAIGPINGVLSAFQHGKSGWFVLGCDYPLLQKSDMESLVKARSTQCVATVFASPTDGRPEPLIGIYEAIAGTMLLQWWREGNQSMRVFLERFEAHLVESAHPERLISVDTPEDFQTIKYGKSGN